MKGSNDADFAPASRVARTLAGDCRQHALLTAAMCRAAGLPSRTAFGLMYAEDPKHGPVLAFHMWTEVWVKGQWLGLDAILGRGSVDATHIKIGDHSWADTETLAPLLPLANVVGHLAIEIVSAE
jgi:hypothetical protein